MMMRSFFLMFLAFAIAGQSKASHKIFNPQIKTLQVIVNNDWISPLPVMRMGQGDVLNISFDELSHTFHRYVYHLEHCEADWTKSEELFESDWLRGFNDNPIEEYQNSINTTVLYTHYKMQIPNDRCGLKMSGNYRLSVYDELNDNECVLTAEFMVTEDIVNVGLSMTTNTDVDLNNSHQQIAMKVNYNNAIRVTNLNEQIYTVLMQNGREQTARYNVRPNLINNVELGWDHRREFIFDAGNEYHKFEILATDHATMGIDHMRWDGNHFNAYPFADTQRRNYLKDEDANGAFYIRNSDNIENDYTTDYVFVHYQLSVPQYSDSQVRVSGQWTTDYNLRNYIMEYDESKNAYFATILQKQGYYNYEYLLYDQEGNCQLAPAEGNFFETENSYQALVYYRGVGERTWRLVGYRQLR